MRKFEASRVSSIGKIDLEEVGYLLEECRPIEMVHFDEAVTSLLVIWPVYLQQKRRLSIDD